MSKTVADLITEYRDRIGQLKRLASDDFRAKNYCGGYQCEGRQKELLLVINDLCHLQSPALETRTDHSCHCPAGIGGECHLTIVECKHRSASFAVACPHCVTPV